MTAADVVLCKHCGRALNIPEGEVRGVHAEGDQRGMWRCSPGDTGQEYGLNADPVGAPCGGSCREAP